MGDPGQRAARARVAGGLEPAAMREAMAEGAALALEEAIAHAVRGRGTRARPAAGWGSLTPTEAALARLVAEGLTNAQIAQRMLVSVATVKVHLSHILAKVGATNRTDLAAGVSRLLPG